MRSQLSNTPCIRRELDLCGIRPALFVHEVPELLDLAWVKEWCVSNVSKRMLRYEITTLSINHVKVECQRVNVSFIKTQWKNRIIWDYILQLYMQMLLISPVTHPRYPNGHQAYLFKDHMKWGRASNTSRPFEIKDCHPNLCHTHQDLRIDLHSGPWCFSVRSLEDLGVGPGAHVAGHHGWLS